jgi:hypothetical protein
MSDIDGKGREGSGDFERGGEGAPIMTDEMKATLAPGGRH